MSNDYPKNMPQNTGYTMGTFNPKTPSWVHHNPTITASGTIDLYPWYSGIAYGRIMVSMYLKYYPILRSEGTYTSGTWRSFPEADKKRYILPFVVDEHGYPRDPGAGEIVNGHCPFPLNSPFLQMIEYANWNNRIDLSDVKTFLECGTAYAQTAVAMSAHFKVITSEALPEVYEANMGKAGIRHPIEFHLTTGCKMLETYITKHPDEKFLILIDDHTPDYQAWIEEELQIIKNCSNRNDHVIIIDDLDHVGFGSYPPDLETVEKLCKEINPEYVLTKMDLYPALYGAPETFIVSVPTKNNNRG